MLENFYQFPKKNTFAPSKLLERLFFNDTITGKS